MTYLIHLQGKPVMVEAKLVLSWDAKGKPLRYTAEIVHSAPTRSGSKATTEASA